ncbi:MAG: hypothetical protein U1A78_09265 [Polyangia bacterium]
MSGAPTFELNFSLTKLRRNVRYTVQRMKQRSWGGAWVTLLEAESKNIDTVIAAELKLSDAVDDAETVVHIADALLDDLVTDTVNAGRTYGGFREFSSDLFGDDSPSRFSQGLLGSQLEGMRHWPPYLKAHIGPLVQAMAPKVEAGLKAADDAEAALTKAESELTNFRSLIQAPLIKKINGLFQQLLGEARKQAASTGEPSEAKGLFLLTEQRRRRRAALTTLTNAEATVATCERALVDAKEALAALQAEAAAEAQADSRRRVRAEQIEALRKQREQADKAIDSLEDEQRRDR